MKTLSLLYKRSKEKVKWIWKKTIQIREKSYRKEIIVNKSILYIYPYISFNSFQLLSHVWFLVTPWIVAIWASLSITNSQSLLKLMSITSVMLSNHLILCHPLLLMPSIFPSMSVFSSESVLHISWLKYWSFSLNISPSNEYSGLISFWINRFDLLAVQRSLKSLLQHHRNSCKTESELRWLRAHVKLIHVDDETKCREERT